MSENQHVDEIEKLQKVLMAKMVGNETSISAFNIQKPTTKSKEIIISTGISSKFVYKY